MTTASGQSVRDTVEQVVREILPEYQDRPVPTDRHLKELGADSVDRVEIIMSVINRLGLTEPMSSFVDIPDVAQLIVFLEGKVGHDHR